MVSTSLLDKPKQLFNSGIMMFFEEYFSHETEAWLASFKV